MATTPEESQQQQQDFDAAFNGADPVKHEMTEDEAFGLDTPAEEAHETPQEAASEAATSGAEGEAGEDGKAPAVAIVLTPEDAKPAGEPDMPMDPKDIQREKSWEGRLKAKEAELKAREEALNKKPDALAEDPSEVAADGDTTAEEAGEPAATEALEEAVEKVQSGELTAEEAMKTLAADFGPDFTKALDALISAKAAEIAGKTADERVGKVAQKMDGIVGEIVDDKARAHFEAISDAHPDFVDVGESPEFKAYIDAMDETQKAAAMKTIEAGSARQIVKLLTTFKDSKKADPAPAVDTASAAAADAAEGVRSSGLKLPEKPAASQDYEKAWDEF